MDLFRATCKEHNLKLTPQRIVIYTELLKSKNHPSADTLFKRVRKTFPDISFDTVNRTLLSFSKIGLATIVEGHSRTRRYDKNVDIHHHFKCLRCNSIIDFYDKAYDNLKIPDELKKRFTVLNKRVVLEGICHKCRKNI